MLKIVIDSRPRDLIMVITQKNEKNIASTLLKRYSKYQESNVERDKTEKRIRNEKKILL